MFLRRTPLSRSTVFTPSTIAGDPETESRIIAASMRPILSVQPRGTLSRSVSV